VIPTKNNGRTLERCLDSIFSQTIPENQIEVIIVDGGSTDETVQTAKQYRVEILSNNAIHQDSFSGGRNIGLSASKGEFIVFLNADQCLSSPEWLSHMLNPFSSDDSVVASVSPLVVDRQSIWLNRYNSYVEFPFISTFSRALGARSIYELFEFGQSPEDKMVTVSIHDRIRLFIGTGMVVRRSVLEAVGGYDFDLDTATRALQAGFRKYCLVRKVGYLHHHYRRNSLRDYLSHKITAMRWFLSFYGSGIGREPMLRNMSGDEMSMRALLVSVLTICTLLGSLVEARKLFLTNKDVASLFHPIASMVTFLSFAMSLMTNSSGRRIVASRAKTSAPK
jgi:glycosyltransferase involved in cell wall biosynthesis